MSGIVATVVIPCYQHQALLSRAVASCQNQTLEPIQIIIIDDGSEPPVEDVWSANDKRVCVARTSNQGLAAARNEGLKLAQGEFIKFLDADDELLPECLAWQVSSLQGMRKTLSIIGYELDDGSARRAVFPKFDQFFESIFILNLAPPHAWAYRTSEIRDTEGFYSGPRTRGGNEDYDFYLRLALSGFEAVTVHKTGARYYQMPGSMSRNRQAMEATLSAVTLYVTQWVIEEEHRFSTRKLFSVLAGLLTKAEQLTDNSAVTERAFLLMSLLSRRENIGDVAADIQRWLDRIQLFGHCAPWTDLITSLNSLIRRNSEETQPLASRHELVSLNYPFNYRSAAQDTALHVVMVLRDFFCRDDRIVLWGAGYWGQYWHSFFQALDLSVVKLVDAQAGDGQMSQGVPVVHPEKLGYEDFNKCVICSLAFYDEIFAELQQRGLSDRCIDLRSLMRGSA